MGARPWTGGCETSDHFHRAVRMLILPSEVSSTRVRPGISIGRQRLQRVARLLRRQNPLSASPAIPGVRAYLR